MRRPTHVFWVGIAIGILTVATVIALTILAHQSHSAKRDAQHACQLALENRLVLHDALVVAQHQAVTPDGQEQLTKLVARVDHLTAEARACASATERDPS